MTSVTSAAQSLVLRAWTEGGQLRVQITPASRRGAEPVVVDSAERAIGIVRAWLALDVLRDQVICDDPPH